MAKRAAFSLAVAIACWGDPACAEQKGPNLQSYVTCEDYAALPANSSVTAAIRRWVIDASRKAFHVSIGEAPPGTKGADIYAYFSEIGNSTILAAFDEKCQSSPGIDIWEAQFGIPMAFELRRIIGRAKQP